MRAVRIHQYGGTETLKLENITKPKINDDDILIAVRSAAINPVDWKIREGYLQAFIPYELPVTLGWDVAGIVVEVGSKVSEFNVGDEVFSRPNIARDGSYADYIAVKADEAVLKSPKLSFSEAAALPLAGITAWQCLVDVANVQPGQRVLIHAGAGGVGHLAIQIAKAKGATVIATASAANQDLLINLGADQAVDYAKSSLKEQIEPVDIVVDTMGGDVQKHSWELLKENGILVSVVDQPDEELAQAHNARAAFVFIEPSSRILKELNSLVEADLLKPLIEHHFTLETIVDAHLQSQSGRTRGKIVIDIN
ncbi:MULTISPECIES: NADP-dependent oxidoreductase [Vibrio]|uniref:NADP-dependent oxidoreductase n=1 Tax=Vibrio cortegadensis TaxID=1328770 RepID=A0ABV4M394_9VIBR|nr:NADP-dependent oxidoreductase [Vibrio sp. 03-59-1]NOH82435.1 NADP-dependent oxidoreductase [Vibrio sp. 03-59-1]RBW64788.1 NADP-dependent oxidoreductase [Vibrionales bacterium C3R12]